MGRRREAQIVDEAEESTDLESSDSIEEEEGCINGEEEVELNEDLQNDEDEGSHYVENDLNANKRKGRKKFKEKKRIGIILNQFSLAIKLN